MGFSLLILKSLEDYIREEEEFSANEVLASVLRNAGCSLETYLWLLKEVDEKKLYESIEKSRNNERDEKCTDEWFRGWIQRQ